MKKYWITKDYLGLFLGIISFFIVSFWWVIYAQRVLEIRLAVLAARVFMPVWVFIICAALYSLLFDYQGGKFSIDTDGVRVYVGLRCYTHSWESLAHCGIVDVSGGAKNAGAYWIYFANRRLTDKERTVFLRKTRRDLANIAFFQYDPELFKLALQFAPEHLRTQLEELPRPEKWKRSPLAVSKR